MRRAEIQNRTCRKCVNKGKEPWNKGLKLTGIHKQNIRNAEKDRVITWGDKISKSLTGRKLSDEHIKSLKDNHVGMTGEKHSADTLVKMSEIKLGKNNPMFERKISDDTRKKHRLSMIDYIKGTIKEGKIMHPNFSKKACIVFEKISKDKNIHIQHAMNGGEFFIEKLGYWLDGYDIENNVVYEYDEKHHYDLSGNLNEKDILRQSQIEDVLKCEFIRIKEDK
jgi:hypothetical protein